MSKYNAWKSFEQELARKLRQMGIEAERCWDEQFAAGGGVDIRTKEYIFQLKYGNRPNLLKAWREANNSRQGREIPIGVARWKNERSTLVCLGLTEFLKLLEKANKN